MPGQNRLSAALFPHRNGHSTQGITWLEDSDILLHYDTSSYIEWMALVNGCYEPEIRNVIERSLRPGDVAFDVGANVGLHTLAMGRKVGSTGAVLAFEPVPALRQRLENNVALNRLDHVEVLLLALSDFEGRGKIYVDSDAWNRGTATLSQSGKKSVPVEISTGDHVISNRRINRLDLVKIDVEGHEFAVIKGMRAGLEKFRPRIIFEYDSRAWRESGASITECCTFLHHMDYRLYTVSEFGASPVTGPHLDFDTNVYCIPVPPHPDSHAVIGAGSDTENT